MIDSTWCPASAGPRRSVALLAVLLGAVSLQAQPAPPAIHVTETAGIRRTTYPVGAHVELPEHAVTDISHIRLRSNGADVPAQFQAASQWADGTVRQLDVDFNVSIGPRETLDYTVEYGASITAPPLPRGLTVTETADTIQVGSVTFNKTGESIIRSVKYRDEDVIGVNGFGVHDPKFPDLRHAVLDTATVVKAGPLKAALRFTGQIALLEPAYRVPFVVTVEMPNTKTWVKLTATFEDPAQRLDSVFFSSVQLLGPPPLLWDFGTPTGAYGVLRDPTSQVSLRETRESNGKTDWNVASGVIVGPGPNPSQILESGADAATEIRWGHVQGTKEAIAFGFEHAEQGSSTIGLSPSSLLVSFTAAQPAREHTLTIYEHFVTAPVQIGAATTATAMLTPLAVR
jgi:hypothetical protein